MNASQPPPTPLEVQHARSRALWMGLGIGFLPAITMLVLISAVSQGWLNLSSGEAKSTVQPLATLGCLFCAGCATVSSLILFKRFKRGVALAGAILLLVVNICVIFFLGCSAILVSAT